MIDTPAASAEDLADLDLLVAMVRHVAAQEIMPRFRNLTDADVTMKSGALDLVTIADRAAEQALTEAVHHVWPETQVIGEEAVAEAPALLDRIAGADRCIVIDPVDGTANFASGQANFGVIVALVRNGRTHAGLLYDPVMDDSVLAVAGGGAWLDRPGAPRQRLRTRATRTLAHAEGFIPMNYWDAATRARKMPLFENVGYLRAMGCSCHEYRTFAMGHSDFIWAESLNPWDHAAGTLIAQEAGGALRVAGVGDYAPTLTKGQLTVAANAALLEALPTA